MSTQFYLIKPDKGEMFGLHDRYGDRYFDQKFWSGSIKGRGLTEYPSFFIAEAMSDPDTVILNTASDVTNFQDASQDERLALAREALDKIVTWAGNDRIWWLSDQDMDDWPYNIGLLAHKPAYVHLLPNYIVLRLTGSVYDVELDGEPR